MSYDFHDIKHIIEAYLDDLATQSKWCDDHPSHLVGHLHPCQYYKYSFEPHKCIFCVISGNYWDLLCPSMDHG
jgi:hypothetical protein